VASVVGALIFMAVFMLAVGALAYGSAMQAEAAQGAEQAEQVAALHGQESLRFSLGASGLTAADAGPATVKVDYLILKYPNGTVYDLPAAAAVPQGGAIQVRSLVPSGVCSPGTATCASKYDEVVAGDPPGSAVGVLTSLGNAFWYSPEADPSADPSLYYWTGALLSTTSAPLAPLAGLSFSGAAGSQYLITADIGYYQSGASSPGIAFAASLPSGSSMMECGGVDLPDSIQSCTSSAGASLGPTTFPGDLVFSADTCTGPTGRCDFLATAMVTFGSAGAFQLEWDVSSGTGYVMADSFIAVTPAQ
jgi:hypothetical protein